MIVGKTKRPRNVDATRAAAILYGDWGTSKAYVIGLAFAIAEASDIFLYARKKADGHTLLPCYAVSDAAAETIVDIAATVGASYSGSAAAKHGRESSER